MSRYSETVRDERGHAIPGVTVYVYDWDAPAQTTGQLSDLTDDDLTTVLVNPLTTDEFGQFYFNTTNGTKMIEYHFAGKLLYREQVILTPTGSYPGNDAALRDDLAADAGSELVSFKLAHAASVARSLESKVRDQAHIRDFGATGDGATDDYSKLAGFIGSLNANPGIPHVMDARTFATSQVLPPITVPNFILLGAGSTIHDVGTLITGTVIKYIGSAAPAARLLQVTATSGGSNQSLTNGQMIGVGFNCNNLIGVGLELLSVSRGKIDAAIANATSKGFVTGVVATLGEARDCHHNWINLRLRQIETPGAYGYELGGDSGANTCFNRFNIDGQYKNVALGNHVNSDNNKMRVRALRGGGGTATESVRFLGGASAAAACRDELIDLSSDQPLKIYGTADFTAPSINHLIILDRTNSTPQPVLGVGATARIINPTVGAVTVAQLPAAGIADRRAIVTDATVTTFASVVAGGGSNKVPVYDDGLAWRIG